MSAASTTAPDPAIQPEFYPYDAVAKALHWIIVGLLIVQYTIAFLMPHVGRDTKPEGLVGLHLSFGGVLILLVLLRVAWRLLRGAPPPPVGLPAWQLVGSRYVHYLLYLLIIAIPILGWTNASYRGWNISVFGIVPLPHLVPARNAAPAGSFSWGWTGDIHTYTSYVLLAIAGLHILAALYHRFVLRDRVLDRMLPQAMAGL